MEHDSLKKEGLLIQLGCINVRDDGKSCNVLVALSVKDKETKKFRLVDRTEPKRCVTSGNKELYWEKKIFVPYRYSLPTSPDTDLELSFSLYDGDGSQDESKDLIGYVPAKASQLKMFGTKSGTFQKYHLTHDTSEIANKLSKMKSKLLINVSNTMGAPVPDLPKAISKPGVCSTCGHSSMEMEELQQRLAAEIESREKTEAINRSLQLQIELANEKLSETLAQHKKSVEISQKTLEERTQALTAIHDSMEKQQSSQESGARSLWAHVQKIVKASEYLRGSLMGKEKALTELSPEQETQKRRELELQIALKKATEEFEAANKDFLQREVEWREKEKHLQESKDYLHRHAKALKSEMKGLLEEIGSLEEKCAELRAALEDMKKAMTDQEGNPEVEAYKRKLVELKTEMEKLKQYRIEADTLRRQLDPLRDTLTQLQEDNERLDEKSKRLADELYGAKTKLSTTLEDMGDLRVRYEELEAQAGSSDQLELLKKQFEDENKSLNSLATELKTQIRGLEKEIEARKVYMDRTNYELERTVRDCSEKLLKVNKALHEKDKELQSTHFQFKDELAKHVTQIAQLQGSVTKVTGQAKDLESSLSTHDEKIVRATDEKIPRSNSVQWKDLYRRIKKQEEKDLKIKLKETNDQLKAMAGDLEAQKQVCLERDYKLAQTREFLESQSSTMRESIKNLLEEISELEERCSDLRSQLEKQKEELSVRQKGVATDSEKLALQELAKRLRDDLSEVNEERDELQTRMEASYKELQRLKSELQDTKYLAEKQERELKNKDLAILEIEKEMKDKSEIIEDLQQSVQEKVHEVVNLLSEKGIVSKRITELEGSSEAKEKEIEELRRTLAELEKVIEEKEKLLEDLKNFIHEKEIELQEKEAEFSEFRTELNTKEQFIEEVTRELEIKKRMYDEKQLELEETLKMSTTSESSEDSLELRASIERLQAANEGMKEKLISYAEDKQSEMKKRDKIIVTANDMLRSLRPWLGLDVVTAKVAKTQIDDVGHFKHRGGGTFENQRTGLAIRDIKAGSPAEKAGLLKSDCIISVNGETTETSEDFKKAIQRCIPGDVLSFLIRDSSENRRIVAFHCGDKHMELRNIQRLRQISQGRIIEDDYKWISSIPQPSPSSSASKNVSQSRIPIFDSNSLSLRVHGLPHPREEGSLTSPSFLVSPNLSPSYSPSISPTSSLEGSPTHHRTELLKATFFPSPAQRSGSSGSTPRTGSGSGRTGSDLSRPEGPLTVRTGSDLSRPGILIQQSETAGLISTGGLSTSTSSTPRIRAQSSLPPLASASREDGTPLARDRSGTGLPQSSSRTPRAPSTRSPNGSITPRNIPRTGIPRRSSGSSSTTLTGLPTPRINIQKTTSPQAF